jgi:hypothetical protein
MLSRIHALYFSLQHTLNLLSLLCLHQPLPGNGSKQCPLLLCSRTYRLATVSQLTNSTVDCQPTRGIFSHCPLAPTGCHLLLTATADGNLLCSLGSDRIENTVSNSSFIVACLFIVVETCLSSCYQAVAGLVSHHVTVYTYIYTGCNWKVRANFGTSSTYQNKKKRAYQHVSRNI